MRHIPEQLETLRQASANQGKLYALMDGALAPELQAALIEHQPPLEYIPLFLGDERGTLAPVSPYLVRFNSFDDSLMWWLLDEGQGKSWGIYLCSQAALTELHHHLFTLLAVRGLEGEKRYFRYYDPRVLRPFWEALTQEEKNRFMGPIQTILVEDEKEPGFWAYQRPKALKPPPYPPAPNDCPAYWLTKPREETGRFLIKRAISQAVKDGVKTDDGIFAYIGLMLHVAPQFMQMRKLHHIHDIPAHTLDEYFPQLLSQWLDNNLVTVSKKIWMRQWHALGTREIIDGRQ